MATKRGLRNWEKNLGRLSPKEAEFVTEYAKDFNGTQAFIRAFGPETSQTSARLGSHRMLHRPHVFKFVTEKVLEKRKKEALTQQRILDEMESIAFGNIKDYSVWDDDGSTLLPSSELTRAQTAAIKELKFSRPTRKAVVDADGNPVYDAQGNVVFEESGGSIDLKLHDKRPALLDLGRHSGIFLEQDGGQDRRPAIDSSIVREKILTKLTAIGSRIVLERSTTVTERVIVEDDARPTFLPPVISNDLT